MIRPRVRLTNTIDRSQNTTSICYMQSLLALCVVGEISLANEVVSLSHKILGFRSKGHLAAVNMVRCLVYTYRIRSGSDCFIAIHSNFRPV